MPKESIVATVKNLVSSFKTYTWRGKTYQVNIPNIKTLFSSTQLNWRGAKYSKKVHPIELKENFPKKELKYRGSTYKK